MQRHKLTVQVAELHHVGVDKRQRSNTGARQRLGRIGADAAQPENGNVGGPQPVFPLLPQQREIP